MFVVSLTYQVALEQVEAQLPEHIAFLQRNYDQGYFLLSGPKLPRSGGVILAKAESLDQLQQILEQDPFMQHGIARYEITEFIPNRSVAELAFLTDS